MDSPSNSGTGAHGAYLRTRVFGSLDGLRAAAIIGVVWFHTTRTPFSWVGLGRGFLGVDFFFLISGFLIVTLLLRERRSTGNISLHSFYVRRCLRIMPAYWLLLLIVASVVYLKPGNGSAALRHDLPYAVLYLSNLVSLSSLLSITWSLSAEEQFYLVVPALQKFLPTLFPYALLPMFLVISVLPPFGLFPTVPMPEFFRQTTFAPILLGVVLACILDSPRGWSHAAAILHNRYSPLLMAAVVGLALSYPGADISGWPRLSIQLTLLLLLASCVVRERHVLGPVLSFKPVARIGVVSYGIYLYHLLAYYPVSRLLERIGHRSEYLLFAGVMACSWLLAELSFRLFEVRFLDLRKRFSAPRVPDSASMGTPSKAAPAP